jgi:hypothetical protein
MFVHEQTNGVVQAMGGRIYAALDVAVIVRAMRLPIRRSGKK